MGTQAAVNPSEETIRIGPLDIRFLLTADDTNGAVSVFEVTVPAGQKGHRSRARPSCVHPARRRSSLRQLRHRGCETVVDSHSRDHGSGLLSRSQRGRECRRGRATGRGQDGRDLPPTWDDHCCTAAGALVVERLSPHATEPANTALQPTDEKRGG